MARTSGPEATSMGLAMYFNMNSSSSPISRSKNPPEVPHSNCPANLEEIQEVLAGETVVELHEMAVLFLLQAQEFFNIFLEGSDNKVLRVLDAVLG